MDINPSIIASICLQKEAALQRRFSASYPTVITSPVPALHLALMYVSAALESVFPAAAAVMPDKAPILIGAWTGCNVLARCITYGLTKQHMKQQVGR